MKENQPQPPPDALALRVAAQLEYAGPIIADRCGIMYAENIQAAVMELRRMAAEIHLLQSGRPAVTLSAVANLPHVVLVEPTTGAHGTIAWAPDQDRAMCTAVSLVQAPGFAGCVSVCVRLRELTRLNNPRKQPIGSS